MTGDELDLEIDRAVAAIQDGGVVGLPTDTVYGIGVDPLREMAVARLFEMKGRPQHKPIGLLVASLEQAAIVGVLDERTMELARAHWPGALTIVVTPRMILSDWVGDAQGRTVALRVPNHPVALELLKATGPLAVTSANRSGGPECLDDVKAREVFGDEVAEYLRGTATGGKASTVVDATGRSLVLLRKGPVGL
jgi:tRNA threonylcarbamoyl adenosine modification protein (Sua5/YciO/YrdC/YwlC family)